MHLRKGFQQGLKNGGALASGAGGGGWGLMRRREKKRSADHIRLLFLIFVSAVCVLFLLKLRWPKTKSIYDQNTFCIYCSGFLLSFKTSRCIEFISIHFFLVRGGGGGGGFYSGFNTFGGGFYPWFIFLFCRSTVLGRRGGGGWGSGC